MRNLFWFLPAVVIPLICLQLSSGQQSSTATVDIRPIPQSPLPSQALLPQVTPASPEIETSPVRPSTKKQAKKVIVQKHPPKTQAKRKKSKEKTRLYTTPAIQIRVAVAQNVSNTVIASSTAANIIDGNGQRLEQLPPSGAFEVSANNSTILLREVQIPSVLWIEPTDSGAVFIGDRWYRGKLLLIAQGDKLLAINYVNLEEYLLSVVGSEMSAAAPIEALKAQAVAARSYALVHTFRPANGWYDLGSDERHQAYKGIAVMSYIC
jgi:peptidoglycan hydrolase-like amidase